MGEKNITRCANPNCTCHTQNAAKFCSDSCARHAEAGSGGGCDCGHAGCASADYVRYRIGNARYENERANRLASRASATRQNDERRNDPPSGGFNGARFER